MHFNDQTISADSESGATSRSDQFAFAGAVRWVGNHGQMRKLAHQRHGGQVERVARHLAFKGLDATLTEHHVVIAAGKKIFRREQPLFYAGGRAALKQDGLKRGPSASVKEWLLAAEYLLAGGNQNVVLCERGIKTFESEMTRNTLDLAAVALVRELSHLPVLADPSHGRSEERRVGK